jgi:hypothetical protein
LTDSGQRVKTRKEAHMKTQLSKPARSNWIVSGLGSANPLGYCCIIQAAEKFADFAQRFAPGLPKSSASPHSSLGALFRRAQPKHSRGHAVFLGHSLQHLLRINRMQRPCHSEVISRRCLCEPFRRSRSFCEAVQTSDLVKLSTVT